MNKDSLVIKEQQIDYNLLRIMKEHAKKYESAVDKKDFLRNVCAYEQKLILLNSTKPYEVLLNLESLNLKSSRLILNELSFDEISDMLYLFSPEDKKSFYTHFSDLELVNQFIKCDNNAVMYVEDLSVDRKVELINSSDKTTIEATETIYETIPVEQRTEVMDSLTSATGAVALSNTQTYQQDQVEEQNDLETETADKSENNDQKEEIQDDNVQEKEEDKEKSETKEKAEQNNSIINDFLKENLELLKQKNSGFEGIDLSAPDIFSILSPELQAIVQELFDSGAKEKEEIKQETIETDTIGEEVVNYSDDIKLNDEMEKEPKLDVEGYKKYSIIGDGEKSASIVKNPDIINEFTKAAQACEQNIIEGLKEQYQNEENLNSNVKTL